MSRARFFFDLALLTGCLALTGLGLYRMYLEGLFE